MKSVFLSLVAIFSLGLTAQAQTAKLCKTDTQFPEFCQRMRNLRATVNTVDSQREMMLVDYNFLSTLANGLIDNSVELQKVVPASLADHNLGLQSVEEIAKELKTKALQKDPEALVTANTLRTQCLNCHSNANPPSGNWNDIFGFDWEKVSKDCNRNGRNPYLCKSMNSLVTDYNQLWTAYTANIQDYAITATVANDMVRILKDLQAKNFNHLGEANRAIAETDALKVVQLAKQKNPEAFTQALNLTDSCMKCHSEVAVQKVKAPMRWGRH